MPSPLWLFEILANEATRRRQLPAPPPPAQVPQAPEEDAGGRNAASRAAEAIVLRLLASYADAGRGIRGLGKVMLGLKRPDPLFGGKPAEGFGTKPEDDWSSDADLLSEPSPRREKKRVAFE